MELSFPAVSEEAVEVKVFNDTISAIIPLFLRQPSMPGRQGCLQDVITSRKLPYCVWRP